MYYISLAMFLFITHDVGKTFGFEAKDQERMLETFLVQNGGFIKARGQDLWAEKSCPGFMRSSQWYTYKLGGG